jgi:hypothetical protein
LFVLVGLRLELRGFMLAKQVHYCLRFISSPFCSGYFGDRVLRTICLDWPGTAIFLIPSSQAAKIIGVGYCSLIKVHILGS